MIAAGTPLNQEQDIMPEYMNMASIEINQTNRIIGIKNTHRKDDKKDQVASSSEPSIFMLFWQKINCVSGPGSVELEKGQIQTEIAVGHTKAAQVIASQKNSSDE